MSSLAGPTVASHRDWYAFIDSGFEAEIVAIWRDEQADLDRRLFVYGDPAFQHVCRIEPSPLAAYYTSVVLLANIYTCLRGNQISRRFGLRPPTLEEYMEDR